MKRLPYKRMTLVIWIIGMVFLLMLGLVSMNFTTNITLGKETSLGGKAEVKITPPIIKEHMFQAEARIGVKVPDLTTSTTTTSTIKYKKVDVEDLLPTPTTTTTLKKVKHRVMPWNTNNEWGVSYKESGRDPGACGK